VYTVFDRENVCKIIGWKNNENIDVLKIIECIFGKWVERMEWGMETIQDCVQYQVHLKKDILFKYFT
jgi:hypothetical protein